MILGIESSCDESALALFSEEKGLVSELVNSQLKLHEEYGGVVPALAAREHLQNFPSLLEQILSHPQASEVSKIAVTFGPGLAGCLALGIAVAKALSIALKKPVVGVNHLRAHAFSPFIQIHKNDPRNFKKNLENLLPHLGLIASGGNTILFEINIHLKISIIAQTIDDAAGEALDKGGKLLGMVYPAGPVIEKTAVGGNSKAFEFPQAFREVSQMRFSFSGLKTSLRYFLEKISDAELKEQLPDICASYQEAIMQILTHKTKQALSQTNYKSLGLSGGVANNKRLRTLFNDLGTSFKIPALIAIPEHTGDNATMIAFAAYADRDGCRISNNFDLSFEPSLPLTN